MATLQKIRNQGGVLVSIFIGVALLAFIVGDALSSGTSMLNSSRNKAGEIAGESIDIQTYQERLTKEEEMMKAMQGIQAFNEEEQRSIRENTWNQMVTEIILNKEMDALGMDVSQEELYDVLLGDNMNPSIRQLFSDPSTGVVSQEMARQRVRQLLNYPNNHPDKQYWLYIEDQFTSMQRQNKFSTLLAKGLYVPNVQINEMLENSAINVDINFLVKNYFSVSDSTVTVSQNEIKAYYDSHQYLFQENESRQIVYVNFNIVPSTEDVTETEAWVNDLKPEFAAATNILEFASLSSETQTNPTYFKRGELGNESLDEFLFDTKSDEVYGPYLQDNAYNILRVADRKMLPDSVKIRHIFIQMAANNAAATEKLTDSLVHLLNSKKASFDLLARQYSADNSSSVNGGDLGWFGQNTLAQPFRDSLFFANKNDIKVIKAPQGFHIMQVTDRTKPVEKVLAGIITKEITPSQRTIGHIYNNVQQFTHNMKSYEEFEQAVAQHNQTKRIANIGKNDYTISGISNARDIIRQAYLTKRTGTLLKNRNESPIFESPDTYTVAFLTTIKKEGIAPLREVSSRIERELIRQKKGDLLAKELLAAKAGSESLLSIAQKTNTEVAEATSISFGSNQIPGAGIEPKLIAGVVGLTEGQFTQPIIGNQGTYIAMVTGRTENPVSPEDIEGTRQYVMQMNTYKVSNQLIPALEKQHDVKDLRYKFY